MYHVYATSYEELEDNLNSLSEDEEVFTINTAGTQAIIITRDREDKKNKAEEMIRERQRLLENMGMRSDRGEIN